MTDDQYNRATSLRHEMEKIQGHINSLVELYDSGDADISICSQSHRFACFLPQKRLEIMIEAEKAEFDKLKEEYSKL